MPDQTSPAQDAADELRRREADPRPWGPTDIPGSVIRPAPVPGARAFIRVTSRGNRPVWLDAERISSVREYSGLNDNCQSTITVDMHSFYVTEEVDDVMALIMRVHHLQATGEAL